MRFSPQILDEIRARLRVSDVVGRKVKLVRAGREFKGLSPFNAEKSPSFFVNDQKGFYHDFSSGKHGDIFTFLMEVEGLSFPEAVERLAAEAGVSLPKPSADDAAKEVRRRTLHEVMELACRFFEGALQSRAGARARGYLADRGLSPSTQQRFRLGFAPDDRSALKQHLAEAGVPIPDMVEAGLLIAGDDIPVPFDRFRDRVMFPILDLKGRVIAFGGRALAKDAPAKYLNSPETPLFHKGATLYNGGPARAAAHDGARVIAVEGYIDVIAMVTAGFEATVAPLGTALTEDQLSALWRMSAEPILCFDGDKAGLRAAFRAVDLALPRLEPGRSLAFATLPEGQDPDDLVRAGGRAAVEAILAQARPLADMLWERESQDAQIDTPERRAALEARLATVLGTIADERVRRHYRDDLAARTAQLFQRSSPAAGGGPGAWRGRGGLPGPRQFRRPNGSVVRLMPTATELAPRGSSLKLSALVRGAAAAIPAREALVLSIFLAHPWLLQHHAEELAELEFAHRDCDRLRRALLDAAAEEVPPDADALAAALARFGADDALERVRRAVTHAADWPARPEAAPADVEACWTHVVGLHHKKRTLSRELREAEEAHAKAQDEGSLAWLRDVQARLAAIEGTEALIEGFGAASGRTSRGF
ncbi:DNA primase [Blastochloris tepida]|uniref:DNA primase n=1 Tax=Blastochloris tepida TaxID=2233851 RepID=A0A348G445_9HYPH|nr:DNA primase [Blastochloris tepida]BBF94328.1 DNA primase [Blastochloris tepida]